MTLLKNRILPNSINLLLLFASFNANADSELVKGKYGELGVTLDLKTAAFAGSNPWFGQAHDNIGDAANFWWEGSVEAGAKGTLNFFGGTDDLWRGNCHI